MKKISTIIMWIAVAVLALAASAGGYFVLHLKPLQDAKEKLTNTMEAYESAYDEYENAVNAYNEKADGYRNAADELTAAHDELKKVIASDAPYNPGMVEDAELVIREQEKLTDSVPEREIPVTKTELSDFPQAETTEEILAAAAAISAETENVKLLTADIKEQTEKMTVPNFNEQIDEVLRWKQKLANSIFDPFDNLIITFSGTEPSGKVGIEKKSNSGIHSRYEFVTEESTKLCNGDEIIISVKPVQNMTEEELNEALAEEYGKAIASFSKTFTVEGLSYYISGAEDLTADTFAKMQSKAEEGLNAYAEKNWNGDVTVQQMDFLGTYFLERKVTNQGFYQDGAKNQLVLLYKAKCLIDLTPRGKDYKKEVDYIYTITYKNVINLADGACALDFGKYSEPDETFKVDTGVKANLFTKYKFTFKGYSDLDSAFNHIITSQSDHYTYTVKIEESAAKD